MKRILIIILTGIVIASCTNDLSELNVNPNQPGTGASTDLAPLLTYLERHTFAESRYNTWRGNLIFGSRFGDQWSFGFSGTWFGNAAGFGYNAGWTDAAWDDPYSKVPATLKSLIDGTSEGASAENPAVNAVARIISGFFFQRMTDQFGSIPYTEAGTGIPTPAFESQQAIYSAIMTDLGDAIEVLKNAGPTHDYAGQDIVYNGDVSKWIKAANTLRLRMALRSKDAPGNISDQVIAAAMAEGEFLSDAEDIFQVSRDYKNADVLFNGYSDIWHTFAGCCGPAAQWVLSNTLVDKLKADNDPRLFVYAQPIEGGTEGVVDDYVGSVVASNADYSNAVTFDSFSKPNARVYSEGEDVLPSIIMTPAEAELLQAEVALDNGNMALAATHFQNGIRASMVQWEVPTADIDAYLAATTLSTDAATAFDQIAIQRWLAAYTYGYEVWSIARRMKVAEQLGFEEKPFTEGGVYGNSAGGAENVLPKRLKYATNTVNLNSQGVAQGNEFNGGPDMMTTKVWWDVD
ncbi:SusD/RagB family nutrient-binding outer membrane lipoprotein [Reichenbachiella ulvae]|uniref:SusD/RagB family nutrient-binding outer membrane lipoprotein n=1 Tax=Reichenbachiella ulvae TaxID=2980104 RepID=A0ABT3CU86_9BACT|nr:SusD/RagB family nutrient-binding outer membrane lipoprotein [Reichenbachiella ulvae]MCV9387084.1 SusD/RagB family nutrient-binding outer membrane lipoprotein [Reichenbachiella ulvae]